VPGNGPSPSPETGEHLPPCLHFAELIDSEDVRSYLGVSRSILSPACFPYEPFFSSRFWLPHAGWMNLGEITTSPFV
jgi:hypothetical protein